MLNCAALADKMAGYGASRDNWVLSG